MKRSSSVTAQSEVIEPKSGNLPDNWALVDPQVVLQVTGPTNCAADIIMPGDTCSSSKPET